MPYDTSIKLNPLSVLPIEIIQQILSHLPPDTYLATKFVSRAFHAATFLPPGYDLRGFKGTRDANNPDQDAYVNSVIQLESGTRYPLELLTCCLCGKRAGNDLNGFSDEQFEQEYEYRGCLSCRRPCTCTVKGVIGRLCYSCDRYVTGDVDEDGSWQPVPAHWCVKKSSVKAPWL